MVLPMPSPYFLHTEWHQLDHMQIICTSLQTDNHTSTSPLSFHRPDALPAAQPTVSKHWRHTNKYIIKYLTGQWTNERKLCNYDAVKRRMHTTRCRNNVSYKLVMNIHSATLFLQFHNVWLLKLITDRSSCLECSKVSKTCCYSFASVSF